MKNSPAFQRWEARDTTTRPEGTAESPPVREMCQLSLRDSHPAERVPGVETPGYCREVPSGLSCAEFLKGIASEDPCRDTGSHSSTLRWLLEDSRADY